MPDDDRPPKKHMATTEALVAIAFIVVAGLVICFCVWMIFK